MNVQVLKSYGKKEGGREVNNLVYTKSPKKISNT